MILKVKRDMKGEKSEIEKCIKMFHSRRKRLGILNKMSSH